MAVDPETAFHIRQAFADLGCTARRSYRAAAVDVCDYPALRPGCLCLVGPAAIGDFSMLYLGRSLRPTL